MKPTDPRSPLILARVIALPDTRGRIDHLAVDIPGRRLFVAEVANGTVDVVDLTAGKVIGRLSGLTEPQGIAWLPDRAELVVGCGDGTVRFFAAADRHETARIVLGEDADNVRVDARNGRVVVGYGSGGLAVIDPATHRILSRTLFKGHPEGFRLSGGQAFVNVPDDGAVLSVDLDQQKVLARWSTGLHRMNFPLAIEPSGQHLVTVYRLPPTLARIDTRTGMTVSSAAACGDADDLFLVGDRALVVCGAGYVQVASRGKTQARVASSPGARTGLYVPEWRQLLVAAPARDASAAIWVMVLRAE